MSKRLPELIGIEDPRAVKQMLENVATKVEEGKYLRDLAQEELDVQRETFVNNSIQISTLLDELDEIKASYKNKLKPLKDENRLLQQSIKMRKEEVQGVLYHVANEEDGMMETYDELGYLIGSRRLTPAEKSQTQGRLFVAHGAARTGTDN